MEKQRKNRVYSNYRKGKSCKSVSCCFFLLITLITLITVYIVKRKVVVFCSIKWVVKGRIVLKRCNSVISVINYRYHRLTDLQLF